MFMHAETESSLKPDVEVRTGANQRGRWPSLADGSWGSPPSIAVDPYIDHMDLEDIIKARIADGWHEHRFMECKQRNDREYCTIIWRKP